jgi:hypothetical protein
MSKKLYVVELNEQERSELNALVRKGKVAAHKRRHAQVLLKVDEGEHGPGWTDERTAEAHEIHPNTVRGIRQRLVEEGLEAAINRKRQKKRGGPRPKLDGAGEARLIALACGPAPEGRARWTLRLLADKALELGIIDEPMTYQTVWERLKKTRSGRTVPDTGSSRPRRMASLWPAWKTSSTSTNSPTIPRPQ